MNIQTLLATSKSFAKKFAMTFFTVLTVHVIILLGLSYVYMEFLVVSGLNFVEWGTIWRALSLVPYLILPMGVASFLTFDSLRHDNNNELTNDDDELMEVDTQGHTD